MSIILIMSLCLVSADFSICTETNSQLYPSAVFANNQYYTFWLDMRYYSADTVYAIFGARITSDGTVLDPDGKELFRRQSNGEPDATSDGIGMLVVFRDSC